jgi:isopentenyl phosphate kinase
VTDGIFLKLGGSLITDKTKPYTPRFDSLERLAREIRNVLLRQPGMRLVVGHGSGSFGHQAATEAWAPHPYPPPAGPDAAGPAPFWRGFEEVWYRASQLNRYVVEALHGAGVPVISLPASASACAAAGQIENWDTAPVEKALDAALVPLIFGDIVFDSARGGSILSTEVLMFELAQQLHPRTILLAGLEAAVWADFPSRQQKVDKITPVSFDSVSGGLGGSHGMDVTGGMRSKVEEMLALVRRVPGVSVRIFSGEESGNVERALLGEQIGTLIESD